MTKKEYDNLLKKYALECIKLDPEDPFQHSMDFANGNFADKWEVYKDFIYNPQSNWSLSEMEGIEGDPQENLDFHNAIDGFDSDICQCIRDLQTTREDAYSIFEQDGAIEWIDGTIFDNYSEWLQAITEITQG